jgi:hypothetical protein
MLKEGRIALKNRLTFYILDKKINETMQQNHQLNYVDQQSSPGSAAEISCAQVTNRAWNITISIIDYLYQYEKYPYASL